MDIEKIITLIKAVSEANITNFQIEEGNFKLIIDKNEKNLNVTPSIVYQVPQNNPMKEMYSESSPVVLDLKNEIKPIINKQETKESSKSNIDSELKEVRSPIVGTYYSASGAGANDFVKVGDQVKKGQTLCIIEAMKLMNDIESDYDGEIVEILMKNEQMVEYNQPLFRIK